MKKLFLLSIVFSLFVSLQISAKPISKPAPAAATSVVNAQTNMLKGQILDKLTKETLAGAVITANGQKVYSDLDGNFEITHLCGDVCQLKISMISYQDQTIDVNVTDEKSLNIKLLQR